MMMLANAPISWVPQPAAAPVCFVIVSEMRSGSTLLTDLLARRLPRVRVYGELMHRYGAWWDASVDAQIGLYEQHGRPAWVKQFRNPEDRYSKFGEFLGAVCGDATARA
jgi:hypothetical protein